MIKTNRYSNNNEFGPWNLILDGNQNVVEDETNHTKEIPFQIRTNRTLRLPRIAPSIDPNVTSKKLVLNLFKQSLQIPKFAKKYDRPRATHMNGSLLTKYKKSTNNSRRYESLSLQLPHPTLQRGMSTIQLGDDDVPAQTEPKTHRYSLNAESAKKRSIQQVVSQMKRNHGLMDFYMLSRYK